MSQSTYTIVKLNGSTRKSDCVSQCPLIRDEVWCAISSLSYSVFTDHQDEEEKHQHNEIHSNADNFAIHSCDVIDSIFPLVKATLCEHVWCCLEFLPIKDRLVCLGLFPTWPVGCQIIDWSNATIDYEITLQEPAPSLLHLLLNWAISQSCSLTLLSFHCIVRPPISCQITMVSAVNYLTPTLVFAAQRQTCWLRIYIVLATVITDFGNQKASHYILAFPRWLMIE